MEIKTRAMRRFPTRELSLSSLFVALIALGAHIAIPVPLAPITLQTLFVVLAGMLLGAKWGVICTAVYIFAGLIGLPVFAEGGGIAYALKPSFGYALGFLPCACLTGLICNAKSAPTFPRLLLASFTGMGALYLVGIPYAYLINIRVLESGLAMGRLLLYGCAVFLPGDLLCCLTAALLAKRLLPIVRRS